LRLPAKKKDMISEKAQYFLTYIQMFVCLWAIWVVVDLAAKLPNDVVKQAMLREIHTSCLHCIACGAYQLFGAKVSTSRVTIANVMLT
jgi:hypothetical protein